MRLKIEDANEPVSGTHSLSNEKCPYCRDPPKMKMDLSKEWMDRYFKFSGCPLIRYCSFAGKYRDCDSQNAVTNSLGLLFEFNHDGLCFSDTVSGELYIFGNEIIIKETPDREFICEFLTIADLIEDCEN